MSHDSGSASQTNRASLVVDEKKTDGVDDDDDEEDDEVISQGHCSSSRTPPPPLAAAQPQTPIAKRDGGVRLSVTSPPPAFAGALSPSSTSASVSVISPFGSPSGWIAPAAAPSPGAVDKTSNVHINGDHVTQVRVDAIVLTPESTTSGGGASRRGNPHRQAEVTGDRDDDDGVEQDKEMAGGGDRDQSEMMVATRLAVSSNSTTLAINKSGSSREKLHVTAVQVEHTSAQEEST